MRNSRMFLTEENSNKIAFLLYNQGSSNSAERERMKHILSRAISKELTKRQRDCLTLHYLQGMKQKDIAKLVNLSASTVSRHITAAENKLRRVASYYEH